MSAEVRECFGEKPFVTEFTSKEGFGPAFKALAKYVREMEKNDRVPYVHVVTTTFEDDDEGGTYFVYSHITANA